MSTDYRVIVQQTADCYCAHSPDVPGCIATGQSEDEARERMGEALRFHLAGLKKAGLAVPEPGGGAP